MSIKHDIPPPDAIVSSRAHVVFIRHRRPGVMTSSRHLPAGSKTDLRHGARYLVTDRRHSRAIRGCPASSAYIDVILSCSVGCGVGCAVSAAVSGGQASVVRN